MERNIDAFFTDNFLLVLIICMIILLIGFIIMIIRFSGLNKRYKNFIKKLENGKTIEEDLENYMYRVERVEKQNLEIAQQTKNIRADLTKCIQKIGIVRYSAFQDTGSDLSFALAMLDEDNNGVVLNGIYSREMSNIYSKPVENGKSSYTLSEEEEEAIKRAIEK